MSEPVAIREAAGRDAAAVADLWTEAYVTHGVGGRVGPYVPADFEATAEAGSVFVVDGGGGELFGVVALLGPGSPGRAVATGGEAELSRLAVALPQRGRGIGRALSELCAWRAREAGWEAIALWSRPGQVEAHRLYESLGYRRAPERDSADRRGERVAFRLGLFPGSAAAAPTEAP